MVARLYDRRRMRLQKQEKYSISIAAVLVVSLVIILISGSIEIGQFIIVVVGSLIAGIGGVLAWGFKSRLGDSRQEAKKVKTLKTTAETTRLEEQEVAHHTKRLRVDEVEEYVFEVHRGDRVAGRISSDGVFSAYFTTESSRRSFYNGYDFSDLEGIEDAFDYSPKFEAPRTGKYYLLIVNEDKKNIRLQVDLRLIHE